MSTQELKRFVIDQIESHATERDFWKSLNEISAYIGGTDDQILKVIKDSDEILESKYMTYTTRNLYKKYTPFFEKFKHCVINEIA